ncbi:hypothetical protein F53441_7951 [Fusarium austroafricanum]|uniref:Enoyl reductase (ER) domain-containing protein n=1 Tax=Fusarium austroafricanum TaxID=2364996 RepID=A0A8H4P594_9HYPO|nr:hypothetical protein F53441_7951 [Fusarium austroafricanum]
MSKSFIPNIAAIIPTKHAPLAIQERFIPTPSKGEMLVRNHVVAANPSDWKAHDYGVLVTEFPGVLGSEISGVIVSVGSDVTRFKPGDCVMAIAQGVLYGNSNRAGFQTYTILDELTTARLPNNLTFEEGAVLPVGMMTASVALFAGLELPMREASDDELAAIVVWSGASAVGVAAVQIAHALGWPVYATASPKHHEWLKTLGATDVWDYRDPQVAQKISQAIKSAGLKIRGIVDARAEGSSFDSVAEILNAAESTTGARITTLSPWPEEKPMPQGAIVHHTDLTRFTTDYTDMTRWLFGGWLEEALKDGRVKPAPKPRVFEGGLEAAQKMLDALKAGASGEKFMLKV